MAGTTERNRTDYTGVVILAFVLPVYLLFYFLGREEMGRSASLVLGMTMLAIRVRWDLRRRFWFWVVIVLVLALHIPLLFLVRWPQGWMPAIAMLPIGVADCLIIVGVIRLVEKFIVKTSPHEEV